MDRFIEHHFGLHHEQRRQTAGQPRSARTMHRRWWRDPINTDERDARTRAI